MEKVLRNQKCNSPSVRFLEVFSIFCMIVEVDRTRDLGWIVSLKRILISEYRGLNIKQKRGFFAYILRKVKIRGFTPLLLLRGR